LGEGRFFLNLEEVASVIERFEEPTLSNILQELNPEPEIAFLINLEAMCERYGKLPKEILSEDAYFLRAFQAILKGKMKGMEAKASQTKGNSMPNFTNKQMRKGFR